jgi:hypothetical protein
MDVQYIISKSLEDHDKISPLIRYLKDETRVKLVPQTRPNNRDLWTFYDVATNEVILETEVEYLSIYNTKLKIWCWAWSVPLLTSLNINLSKEMLLYALKLGPEMSYLKSILITSRGTVVDPIQLDIHLALASYILKQPYIYPYKRPIENYNMIYHYILLNTEDLDKLFVEIKNP